MNDEIVNKWLDKEYGVSYNELERIHDYLLTENHKLKDKYNKLQSNWNSLREWLENNYEESHDIWYVKIINKMNELEGKDNNGI